MQTLKTTQGTYRLSPTRNTGEFLAKLNKCAGKFKPTKGKADRRAYPAFEPGMSTAEYVEAYARMNPTGAFAGVQGVQTTAPLACAPGWAKQRRYFGHLNEQPCTLYTGADTFEEISGDIIEFPAPMALAA